MLAQTWDAVILCFMMSMLVGQTACRSVERTASFLLTAAAAALCSRLADWASSVRVSVLSDLYSALSGEWPFLPRTVTARKRRRPGVASCRHFHPFYLYSPFAVARPPDRPAVRPVLMTSQPLQHYDACSFPQLVSSTMAAVDYRARQQFAWKLQNLHFQSKIKGQSGLSYRGIIYTIVL